MAATLLLPRPAAGDEELIGRVDERIRRGERSALARVLDNLVLGRIGVSQRDRRELRDALDQLRHRRVNGAR